MRRLLLSILVVSIASSHCLLPRCWCDAFEISRDRQLENPNISRRNTLRSKEEIISKSKPIVLLGQSSSTAAATTTDDSNGIRANDNSRNRGKVNDWKDKLLQISNVASLLCVIDCTVLPVVTVLLPLIGLGATPEQDIWLHHLGHKVAMKFVLPVGSLAAIMNYTSHKNASLSLVSLIGLVFIYAANASCHSYILSIFPHHLIHFLHDGLTHRCVNVSGCALLLGSNYLGHKVGCKDHRGHGSCCH
mmetsp:Transcript_3655/g.4156  ORF Transcript_3655/g.4156 Transcript_3655/m.4156 type:complete len:247 (+) Transcript_3655:41-781(+)